MKRNALTRERITALYATFKPEDWGWNSWFRDYTRELEWVKSCSDDALKLPAAQKRIWGMEQLGGSGPSRSIDAMPMIQDADFVRTLVDLRKRGVDPMPSRRAKELDAVHKALSDRMQELTGDGRTPHARLMRAMHAVLPGDFHCVWNQQAQIVVRDFLFGERGGSTVENHVHVRARLRDVLGAEPDLAEHAKRAMFCWWLSEHAEEIEGGGIPVPTGVPEPPPHEEAALERLQLRPLSRQYLWLDVYKSGLDSVRLALRECLEPQTVETLTTALGDELELAVMNKRYLPTLLRDLQHLGLVSRKGEEYTTTDAGEALLDAGGEEILGEALVTRVKGFALILRALSKAAKTGPQVADLLEPFTTAISKGHLAQRHLWWARAARLVTIVGDTREITEQGRELVRRLPDSLTTPEPAAPVEEEVFDDVEVVAVDAKPHPELPALWTAFQALATSKGIVFSKSQVRALHAAWAFGERKLNGADAVKRFAILSGLSGTGKTQLLICYANAVCQAMGLDPKAHIALVPVRPDWRDPSGLLGYFNALHAEPTFQAEPALRLVIRASKHPHLPFFLLLDEMNLARVERYFAPFLSAMEVGGSIDLHAFDEPVNGVPSTVRWPSNLRIGGTVNMDETTHAFSDKVLDRAFTLEFWDVDIEGFFAARPTRQSADAPVEQTLRAVQACLRPIRRHVGYRTLGEVLDWVATAREADPDATAQDLMDQALFSKVLPRLRGHETAGLHEALEALAKLTKEQALPICYEKVTTMHARLRDTGVTGFWS